MRVIQDICNHSSITTTERYVHIKGQAIDLLSETLAKRAKERQKEGG